jgi:hypothetical protein
MDIDKLARKLAKVYFVNENFDFMSDRWMKLTKAVAVMVLDARIEEHNRSCYDCNESECNRDVQLQAEKDEITKL